MAVNFNPIPLLGTRCRTTASARMFPSWTRNSSWAFTPSGCRTGVERNSPPTLRSLTRDTSSISPQRQQTHIPSGVSTRELNLLEYKGLDSTAPTDHLWPCGFGRVVEQQVAKPAQTVIGSWWAINPGKTLKISQDLTEHGVERVQRGHAGTSLAIGVL